MENIWEKNTLLRETGRAFVSDLVNSTVRGAAKVASAGARLIGADDTADRLAKVEGVYTPADRTAADLTDDQRKFLADTWKIEGDGIYNAYQNYGKVADRNGDTSYRDSDWNFMDTRPAHQVEQLFGRAATRWNGDDLELVDTYDLNFGKTNLPGIPTNADPDSTKIHSRISAKALGLNPKDLYDTAVNNLQSEWEKMSSTLPKAEADYAEALKTGASIHGSTAERVLDAASVLNSRWNRINSGPYKTEAGNGIGSWIDPRRRQDTQMDAKGGDYAAHSESTGPTDEQLQEAVEFLETVMEIGAPQNEWEQSIVQRTHDILAKTLEAHRSGSEGSPDSDLNAGRP